MKELLDICNALEKLGDEPCALATVIQVVGSAYRRPGARMLMTTKGQSWGMISGGCLEQDVLAHAKNALKSNRSQQVRYDSTSNDDILFGTGLGCNGIIDVLIEPVTASFRNSFIRIIKNCWQQRQEATLATLMPNESEPGHDYAYYWDGSWSGSQKLIFLLDGHVEGRKEPFLFHNESAGCNTRIFVQPLQPPVQLVIFGGWLDVAPLVRIAHEVGFRVVVVDARRRESSRSLFSEADLVLLCSPAEALEQIQLDDRSAAMMMNHHYEHDQEVLAALTQSSLPYVGLLGPKRRQQRIVDAVRTTGVPISEEFMRSLRGPAGLDLGAKCPEEIALSIMAEILAVLNARTAKSICRQPVRLPVYSPELTYV